MTLFPARIDLALKTLRLNAPPSARASPPSPSRQRVRCARRRVHRDVEAVEYSNLLSKAECERLVDELKRREDWVDKCSKKHVRDSEGLEVDNGAAFAALLGARLKVRDGLPEAWRRRVVLKGCSDGDVGTEGTWAPHRVNERVRATRYRRGGHFAPHRDGVILPRDGERSFLTILLYLTDDFSGGETVFLRDHEGLEYGAFDEADILARVAPEAGKALVFLQNELHAGMPVEAAEGDDEPRKYILITEVFYELVEPPAESWDPASVALLREAEAHEANGAFEEAVRCYSALRRRDPEFARHAGVP